MATIATWNGHTFEVGPKLIRGLNGITIKGGCETTDKNTNGQKYLERKYGEIPEISLTTQLSMLTGVTDVFTEAMTWVNDAVYGAADYFYMGSRKVFPAKMILTNAEVTELATLPGTGDIWISATLKLDFKQGSPNDGDDVAEPEGDDGGGGGAGKKKSVKKKDNPPKFTKESLAITAGAVTVPVTKDTSKATDSGTKTNVTTGRGWLSNGFAKLTKK